MRLNDLIPHFAHEPRARISNKEKNCEYESFEAALIACGRAGYDQAAIADVVLRKTVIYRLRLIAEDHPHLTANHARQLLALALTRRNGRLSVLDLGGGCGVHYFLAKKLFENQLQLQWSVVETPAMVAKARALESDELHFFSDMKTAISAGPTPNLAFSSGTLHYLPNPYQALEGLMSVGAQNLFLTRVALSHDEKDHVFIHESALSRHGRGKPLATAPDIKTYCPTFFASKLKLEGLLTRKYEIVLELAEAMDAYKFGDLSFNQYGYYCRLRE